MEEVGPWCGQPWDRGRLRNRTEQNAAAREAREDFNRGDVSAGQDFFCHTTRIPRCSVDSLSTEPADASCRRTLQ